MHFHVMAVVRIQQIQSADRTVTRTCRTGEFGNHVPATGVFTTDDVEYDLRRTMFPSDAGRQWPARTASQRMDRTRGR